MDGNRSERTPRRSGPGKSSAPDNPSPGNPSSQERPVVSPRWLLGALLSILGLVVLCIYGTICLLFWQGQWQLVFHPSHALAPTPAAAGLKFDDIHFDATETGILQLNGWWIPADPAGQHAGSTILFLHDGVGSLSNSVDQLRVLHTLGINVFAFDYRGFGASARIHPSEKRVREDADAAWLYLTGMRHLRPETIVIYGAGLGAAIAAETARRHPQAAALVLENPQPPVLEGLRRNPRVRWLPLRLIFQDRFDPAGTLALLTMPKLFLETSPRRPLYYDQAAQPKTAVVLSSPPYRDAAYTAAVNRFLYSHLRSSF